MGITIDLSLIAPHIILSVGALLLFIFALFRKPLWGVGTALATLTCLLAGISLITLVPQASKESFSQHILLDPFGLYLFGVVLLGTLLVIYISLPYLMESGKGLLEYLGLLLLATTGIGFLVMSLHFITLYIGLELLSLSSYCLAAFYREEPKSFEAGFKYFILGTFSSAILLYGISLVYGRTGALHLKAIAEALPPEDPLVLIGLIFILAGVGFKLAAVPFHIWTPDVYEGAPTPITIFFSVGPKAAGFALALRILFLAFPAWHLQWSLFVGLLAALTMVLGNLVALVQTNVKRMLAYSAIAHTGYMLLGILAYNALGQQAILYYLLAYTFMNIGAFTAVIYLIPRAYSDERVLDFTGLAKTHPWLAFATLVFMLSLAGIPPTAGFFGKLYLFAATIQAGYIPLAVLGVIMSVVSLYYYFGIVVSMYLKEDKPPVSLRSHWALGMVLIITTLGTLGLGIFPQKTLILLEKALLPLLS